MSHRLTPVLVLLALLAATPAHAAWKHLPVPQLVAQSTQNPARNVSLDQAVAEVRRLSGGTILRAETRTSGGHVVYYIKVLSRDGRIRTYRVDAQSGRVSP